MKKLLLLVAAAVLPLSSPPAAAQQPNFDLKEWDVEWGGGTCDPAVAPDGKVWFVSQAGNYVAVFDPKTAQFKRYEIEPGTNPHTIIVDPRGSRGTPAIATTASVASTRRRARSRPS